MVPNSSTRLELNNRGHENKSSRKINSRTFLICNDLLVDPVREKSNYIFETLIVLCERLDELDTENDNSCGKIGDANIY